ncbi:hypothetical protein TYRP_019903 [Tyrophagus putrescentiae]|nr:hypothetical protein TYRP_019903 [Tyrophagus putrescentiae]
MASDEAVREGYAARGTYAGRFIAWPLSTSPVGNEQSDDENRLRRLAGLSRALRPFDLRGPH